MRFLSYLLAVGSIAACTQLNAQHIGIDLDKKQVGIIARVSDLSNSRTVPKGMVDYVLCTPGQKELSSMFITEATPAQLRDMLIRVGGKPGRAAIEADGEYKLPAGGRYKILVEWLDGQEMQRMPLEEMTIDQKQQRLIPDADWVFTGSRIIKDPETNQNMLEANKTQSMIALTHDETALIVNPFRVAKTPGRYRANARKLPKAQFVRLLVEYKFNEDPNDPIPEKYVGKDPRLHWILSGRIRGVRYREFVEGYARKYGVKGWVRNLSDGRLELVAEGDSKIMKRFAQTIGKGPRGAKVENIEKKPPMAGKLGRFEIRETVDP